MKLEDLTYDSDFDNEHDDVQMELPPDIASQDKFPALGETIEEHHEPAVATTQKTVEQITTELGLDFAKALRMAPAVSTNDKVLSIRIFMDVKIRLGGTVCDESKCTTNIVSTKTQV